LNKQNWRNDVMSIYKVVLSAEDHGYEINLVKSCFSVDENKKSVETQTVITCLAIIWEQREAYEAFDTLNTFLAVCAEQKILPENTFRHITRKKGE
jgi:DNA recombination-dependent growth factor C